MNKLDDVKYIKKLDKSDMLGSINFLPKQIKQAWQEARQVNLPKGYKNIDKIVINGMGGSGLGTHVIQSLYFKELKVSVGNIHSYDLPGIVDDKSLYIISSYSGNTEEPVSTFKAAKERGAKILGITSGGKLLQIIKSGQIPGYVFEPKYNPCNQPRMGIGYSVSGLFGLMKKLGIIKVSDQEIKKVISWLNLLKQNLAAEVATQENPAKQLAVVLRDKIPVIIAAEFLTGNAHVLANQINENAKNFSTYYIISELNHHLMEGLTYPPNNSQNLYFVFFDSDLYLRRNKKRIEITQKILAKHHIGHSIYKLKAKNPLEQSFEMLMMGSYVSFYLSILNNVDPSPIPWVDYFKKELAK